MASCIPNSANLLRRQLLILVACCGELMDAVHAVKSGVVLIKSTKMSLASGVRQIALGTLVSRDKLRP